MKLTQKETIKVLKMLKHLKQDRQEAIDTYKKWQEVYGDSLIYKAYHSSGLPLKKWESYFKLLSKTK